MKQRLQIIVLSAVFAIIFSACSSFPGNCGKPKDSGKQENIVNTKWVLAENGKGKTPTLSFDNGKISGNAGCNNYFSNDVVLDATAGNFSVKNIATTKMACENMSVESNYIDMLQKVNKYVYNGSTLELYKDNLLLLKFNKQ